VLLVQASEMQARSTAADSSAEEVLSKLRQLERLLADLRDFSQEQWRKCAEDQAEQGTDIARLQQTLSELVAEIRSRETATTERGGGGGGQVREFLKCSAPGAFHWIACDRRYSRVTHVPLSVSSSARCLLLCHWRDGMALVANRTRHETEVACTFSFERMHSLRRRGVHVGADLAAALSVHSEHANHHTSRQAKRRRLRERCFHQTRVAAFQGHKCSVFTVLNNATL
jgi:hypothetical protein